MGWMGLLVKRTLLRRRMRKLITRRNQFIRQAAESME